MSLITQNLSLKTFDGLVEAMTDWLNRVGSANLANRCQEFIQLFEVQADRELRVAELIQRSTASLSSGYLRLPADWAEAKRVTLTTTFPSGVSRPKVLDPLPNQQADDERSRAIDRGDVQPKWFCINGFYLEVVPFVTAPLPVELLYYRKVSSMAIGPSVQTSPILTAFPDLYLYGSLLHSAPYLRDDERVAMWADIYGKSLQTANDSADKAENSGGTLRTRARRR